MSFSLKQKISRELKGFLLGVLFCSLSGVGAETPVRGTTGKLFILDGSGSMNDYIGAFQKVHLAKKYIAKLIDQYSEDSEIGLIAYGNRIPGCGSSRLYFPLEKFKRTEFKNKLYSITPAGATPLAESIRIAGDYMKKKSTETDLILVTDGVESCYGDPEKELQRLKQQGVRFKMHILGLGLKPEEKRIMQKIAESADGSYYNIDSDSDFANAITELSRNRNDQSVLRNEVESTQKHSLPGKIQIVDIQKGTERDSYTIFYTFENPGTKNHCVVLNGISTGTTNPRMNAPSPSRSKDLDRLLGLDLQCFEAENGKGEFTLKNAGPISHKIELELWNMDEIPAAVARDDKILADQGK
ncbi:hypothetical protein CH373_01265 [Leptospira perolatii]|uniref:VWFA domain-containing protein n=1 Tax=Leptospira perolatii TaxID=2023191 RepID=A0A2M9ZRI8_9LEPT|nr:vWA domain-containing protein [Leptospira perolatii]PJZ71175.1 hypothetical protein CH360_01265 [Leptospira perolatii]PJZ74708.1 hypothetical protein CH373_01265 [Leptospira perolatii]